MVLVIRKKTDVLQERMSARSTNLEVAFSTIYVRGKVEDGAANYRRLVEQATCNLQPATGSLLCNSAVAPRLVSRRGKTWVVVVDTAY